MLVLGRKVGEAIVMSGGIRIEVVEVGGGRVRLAIQAPQSVEIWRQELCPPDMLAAVPPVNPNGGKR